MRLRTLVIVTNADGALLPNSMGPESLDGNRATDVISREGVKMVQGSAYLAMASWVKSSQKPKTGLARTSRMAYATISALTSMLRDPSAIPQMLVHISYFLDKTRVGELGIHGVDGPQNQSETSNSAEEGGGLGILAHDNTTTVEAELVDDGQVGDASNGIPTPFWSFLKSEGGEEAGQDHDDISDDSHEDAGTVKTGQEAKVE